MDLKFFAQTIKKNMANLNIAVVVTLVSMQVFAQTNVVINARDLYAEYLPNPLTADAKYEGRTLIITGNVIKSDFVDIGVGHIRSVLLAGDKSSQTTTSIAVCFTESCSSFRRPTIDDETFKAIRIGSVITAICIAQPVKFDSSRVGKMVDIALSKCMLR